MRLTASLLAILISAVPAAAAPSGKEIVDKVLAQPSPDHAIAVLKMTISGENAGIRQLTSYMKRTGGRTKSVVKFQEPADYRGAGILVIEKDGGEMDRSIRLNGQKRVRRLPAGSQKGAFLNTDFSYEDLDGRKEIKTDKHNLLREEVLQGQACFVVETVPDEDGDSAYKRIVQWIRKDNFVPVQIEFRGNIKGEVGGFKCIVGQRVRDARHRNGNLHKHIFTGDEFIQIARVERVDDADVALAPIHDLFAEVEIEIAAANAHITFIQAKVVFAAGALSRESVVLGQQREGGTRIFTGV